MHHGLERLRLDRSRSRQPADAGGYHKGCDGLPEIEHR